MAMSSMQLIMLNLQKVTFKVNIVGFFLMIK